MVRKTTICIVFLLIIWIFPFRAGAAEGKQQNNILQAQLTKSSSDNNETGNHESEQKLFVHGYLSQAYARTNEHTLWGITKDGTADYRSAALQFRYAITAKDNLVIQFNHERLGESPAMQFRSDVELNWAFYERHFADATILKVGKIPIPMGIYNEIKHVGTILPFYATMSTLYGIASFTSETVDGFVLSHSINMKHDWGLDLDAYYGSWSYIAQTDTFYKTKAKNALGFQAWLNTPVNGLRFGIGLMHYKSPTTSFGAIGEESNWTNWHFSADGSFRRFKIQSEYRHVSYKGETYFVWYGLFGVHVIERLVLNVEAETSKIRIEVPMIGILKVTMDRDYAAGINYMFRSDVVMKFEVHWNKGFWYEDQDIMALLMNQPYLARYMILSLAASF